MNNEVKRLKCISRINLLSERDSEGNKYLINKLKRILRKLEATK